jgi:hypothetical protein
MVIRQSIAAYSQNRKKHINTLSLENAESFTVKKMVHVITTVL